VQTAIQLSPASRIGRFARNYRHHLLLAVGCVLVLLLLGSSHWQGTASLSALGGLRHQAERVERLDSLLIQLMDAENAVRGYLLSGNRAHLEPYEASLATVNVTLEEIRRDLGQNRENDDALADLSGLVSIKFKSLNDAVERGIAGVETRIQGKRYTDRIRDRILGLNANLAAEGQVSFERSIRHVERTRWVVATLAVSALALIAILFFVLERQIRLREQVASLLQGENHRLDAVVRERTAELSDLATYLTNVREAEKARLARDLHDELGSLLTAAKMEAGWIARKLDDATVTACLERLTRLDNILDSGIALKRRIIDDLRPPLLEMLGLVSALRGLAEEFTRDANEALRLELPVVDIDVDPTLALAIFRIVQEALTNIRKHAHARQVNLSLRIVDEHWLELAIEDDGLGFQPGQARWGHHGLAGMKHRVQMCAGEFTLTSRPGEGTRIVVRIPAMAAPVPEVVDQEDIACRT
jgi:signal transduction histidine kinase